MRRTPMTPRSDWPRRVERQGLVYHHWRDEDVLRQYWVEDACYELDADEARSLLAVTDELHAMCLEVAQHVVDRDRFDEVGIPPELAPHVAESWRRGDPTLYGRFDLVHDGEGPPKLLEYNADTPTCLLEAAVVQWHWLQDVAPAHDQLNALHDHLVATWSVLAESMRPGPLHVLHSGADGYGEEWFTALYLQDTAAQAGLETRALRTDELQWDPAAGRFLDPEGEPVVNLYKLYPWEWLLAEDGVADAALQSLATTSWVEPLWKLLVSSKGVLPLLWELFPGHPNLLPSRLDEPGDLTAWARKPLFGREGSNVTLSLPGHEVSRGGPYASDRVVYQQLAPLPRFGGGHAVVGSWVIGHRACGIGIRESADLITDERQVFLPHLVRTGDA